MMAPCWDGARPPEKGFLAYTEGVRAAQRLRRCVGAASRRALQKSRATFFDHILTVTRPRNSNSSAIRAVSAAILQSRSDDRGASAGFAPEFPNRTLTRAFN
jgi:hypothetical protein